MGMKSLKWLLVYALTSMRFIIIIIIVCMRSIIIFFFFEWETMRGKSVNVHVQFHSNEAQKIQRRHRFQFGLFAFQLDSNGCGVWRMGTLNSAALSINSLVVLI